MWLYLQRPDLDYIQNFEQKRRMLEEALSQAWASIEDSVVRGCFESMNRDFKMSSTLRAGMQSTR